VPAAPSALPRERFRSLTRKRHWPAADCCGARGQPPGAPARALKASVILLHEAVEEGRKLRVGIERQDVGNILVRRLAQSSLYLPDAVNRV
jgi:hypothetical protein